jgi:two-component system chemotaxis response regulator CheY
MGFTVVEAPNGQSAIKELHRRSFDLVCLDLCLPELSGYDICEHIRHAPALEDIPVLVISARVMPMDRALAEELGASAFLIKPFRVADLEAQVATLLRPRAKRSRQVAS